MISWRIAGLLGFQLFHVCLGLVPQLRSGALEVGFQQLHTMMEGMMNPFEDFMNEVTKCFLEKVKDVCMIVKIFSSEEVYDGSLVRIFVYLCEGVSLYVGLY